jgi:hypothetical protein
MCSLKSLFFKTKKQTYRTWECHDGGLPGYDVYSDGYVLYQSFGEWTGSLRSLSWRHDIFPKRQNLSELHHATRHSHTHTYRSSKKRSQIAAHWNNRPVDTWVFTLTFQFVYLFIYLFICGAFGNDTRKRIRADYMWGTAAMLHVKSVTLSEEKGPMEMSGPDRLEKIVQREKFMTFTVLPRLLWWSTRRHVARICIGEGMKGKTSLGSQPEELSAFQHEICYLKYLAGWCQRISI